jgi:S1/P1 Nuclease
MCSRQSLSFLELAQKSVDPERVVALKFILHFVGDVHQPLHAADHDDQGGNKVMVLYEAGRSAHPCMAAGTLRL